MASTATLSMVVQQILQNTQEQGTLRTERRNLIEKVGQLTEQIAKSQEEIAGLLAREIDLKEMLANSINQNALLTKQIEEVAKQLAFVQENYSTLKEQYKALKNEVEEESRIKEELKELEKELRELEKRLSRYDLQSIGMSIAGLVVGSFFGAPFIGFFGGGSFGVCISAEVPVYISTIKRKINPLREKLGLETL